VEFFYAPLAIPRGINLPFSDVPGVTLSSSINLEADGKLVVFHYSTRLLDGVQ
jgi:hypothetical protein